MLNEKLISWRARLRCGGFCSFTTGCANPEDPAWGTLLTRPIRPAGLVELQWHKLGYMKSRPASSSLDSMQHRPWMHGETDHTSQQSLRSCSLLFVEFGVTLRRVRSARDYFWGCWRLSSCGHLLCMGLAQRMGSQKVSCCVSRRDAVERPAARDF